MLSSRISQTDCRIIEDIVASDTSENVAARERRYPGDT